jgi:hypothetical protein
MNWNHFVRDIAQLLIAIFLLGIIGGFVITEITERIHYVLTRKHYFAKDIKDK